MSPKVSILLPNLNNRPYLDERIHSILNQTFTDWELIIVDNYSNDGAWEFFQEFVKKDSRIRISQAPRKGMYANWNNCIRLAKGDYVYIATSDDTMSPGFLKTMATTLDEYPTCDLAHCKLTIIDENGKKHPKLLWDNFLCSSYFGDLINKKHIRVAPHDGILHCGVKTVYTSITQLLIRKTLFDRIGLFLTNYGSIADFEWEMRASLVANTIHIPEYLATWRVHCDQGTDQDFLNTSKHRSQLLEMIDHAFSVAKKINPALNKITQIDLLKKFYLKEKLLLEIKEQKREIDKYKIGLKWLVRKPAIFFACLMYSRTLRKYFSPSQPALDFSRSILTRYGFANNYEIID